MTGNPGQEEGQLLQVADWLRVYRGGARPEALLAACLERARSKSPPATWIYLATDADLRGQLDALQALADGLSGIDAILQRLPLFGVPFAVKDNIDIAGVHTTAACPAYARIADGTSACVRRLQAAGAVWIGKTNLDQFATGLVGTRSPYGQPSSALDATRISGCRGRTGGFLARHGYCGIRAHPGRIQPIGGPQADTRSGGDQRRGAGVPQHRLRVRVCNDGR